MVFQNYALFPHMSVAQERRLRAADARRRRRPRSRRASTRALKLVQLTGQEDKLPGQLSGGQQQRVAIARAIVIEPPLVLMDEPLSNLDAKLRLETRSEIRRIHRELDRTTIYVTHDQDEALSLADRIVVMRGRRRAAGRPRRRRSTRSRRTSTSRASWAIATCVELAGRARGRRSRDARRRRHAAHRHAQAAARRRARVRRDPARGDHRRRRARRA